MLAVWCAVGACACAHVCRTPVFARARGGCARSLANRVDSIPVNRPLTPSLGTRPGRTREWRILYRLLGGRCFSQTQRSRRRSSTSGTLPSSTHQQRHPLSSSSSSLPLPIPVPLSPLAASSALDLATHSSQLSIHAVDIFQSNVPNVTVRLEGLRVGQRERAQQRGL